MNAPITPTVDAPMIPPELVAPAFAPSTFADRDAVHALFTRLRRDYPLNQVEVPGYDPHWIVTKYADLREIARQDDIFHGGDRSKTLISQAGEELVKQYTGGQSNIFRSLVQLDPPEHKKYRDVAADSFSLASMKALKPMVDGIARDYAERFFAHAPEVDFAGEIAFHYPLKVVLDLIGVPEADHPKMLELTQWLFTWADPDLRRPGSNLEDPTEITKTWGIVFDEFEKYYTPIIEDRRRCPAHDLATVLANGKVDGGPLEHRALISYFIIASTAGHDTTAATTGTGMWQLAERPDILAMLKADPALIPGFVEETIRWATPVQQFVRSATQDYQIKGRTIKKGDLVYLSYLSANRDEEAFEDPFTFNPLRSPNRHVGFGFGGHTCLGIHLARMEMISFWQQVIPRLKSVTLTGTPRMAESEFVCGPKSVPIRFEVEPD
ncbi:cytochrome P450 [Sphingomonas lacunae]|uniref:Cytochrome P450 n=1 Tax=Sphingomonas lacunae TaxID=2698828 RepID=A0A6M4AU18_9SPHN|nr:cytochrome P450 [Sphingomonas lacunae]QJQ32236.1 cytochrome P450 [Sphingomonas lacunae]